MFYFKAQKLSKPSIDFDQNYMKSFYSICLLIVVYFYFISAKDYEINHDQIELHNTIGQGQFGDVHRGTYTFPVSAWRISNIIICSVILIIIFSEMNFYFSCC